MKIFPKKEWVNVNKTIVGFGQSICKAKKPMCEECPINKLCTADENYTKIVKKKIKKVQYEEIEQEENDEKGYDEEKEEGIDASKVKKKRSRVL